MLKLFLPIDGSECSNNTLAWASKTFHAADWEYYLLEVINLRPEMMIVEYDIADAIQNLSQAKSFLLQQGCTVAKSQYVVGETADQICAYAHAIQADLVVLGSHGRTGLSKILIGSTSIAVMEHCQQPVVIYRNAPIHSIAGQAHKGRTGMNTRTIL